MNFASHSPEPPPLAEAARRRLADCFDAGRLLTDRADCLAYAYDNSRQLALPVAVAFAQTDSEVAEAIEVCNAYRIPLTARGRGTNTTGATVPVAGGLVLSFERMNRILRLSPGDRLLECEAGVLNSEVQQAAGAQRLFWAPDPTSAAYSTVGGNLACGAGGPRAVKYGTARDNVLGLSAISGGGVPIRSGCLTTKGVVGYDFTRLLVGSEGTLALITRAALKLLPKPAQSRAMRAAYRDVETAAAAVARLMRQPHTPSALEFLDADAVSLAESYRPSGVPTGTGALLLIEADGDAQALDVSCEAIEQAARGEGLIEWRMARLPEEAEALWASRKALSPSLRRIAPKKINEDVVVPVSRLPELVRGLRGLAERHAIRIVTFGHAGNGNLHVNLLADPGDIAQAAAIERCLDEVLRLVLSLEGTLSGEHGVGLVKRDFVGLEIPEATLGLMRQVKSVFDPLGILNPGKTLPSIPA